MASKADVEMRKEGYREGEKEQLQEEAMEQKEVGKRAAELEKEEDLSTKEAVKAAQYRKNLEEGRGVEGSLYSVGSSIKSGLSGLFSGGGGDDSGGKKTSKGGGPAAPQGKSLSNLSDLQKEYYRETGQWPRIGRKQTMDYWEWKQDRTAAKTGRRQEEGSRSPFTGDGGMGRHPLAKSDRGGPARNPITTGGGEGAKPPAVFSTGSENDPDESGDMRDNNPFKLQGSEKEADNPFKSSGGKKKRSNPFEGG